MNERDLSISDETAGQVIALAHHAGRKNWVPATSGNFSVRIDSGSCAVTASGGDKAALTREGIIRGNLRGPRHPRESAEAPLHYCLYRLHADIGAVAHVHAQSSVIASMKLAHADAVTLEGLEMLKAFQGVTTHEMRIDIPVFDNDQDMDALAGRVETRLAQPGNAKGFLLAGHGLYAWGRNAQETLRHLDAFDYIFTLCLKLKGIPA